MIENILLVGLGNPGAEYQDSRHNIGFKIIDAVAADSSSGSFKKMTSVADVSFFFYRKR